MDKHRSEQYNPTPAGIAPGARNQANTRSTPETGGKAETGITPDSKGQPKSRTASGRGTLYLIPSSLGEKDLHTVWPAGHHDLINRLHFFIVENIRTTRRFLKRAGYHTDFKHVQFFLLDKHRSEEEYTVFLQPALEGHSIGLFSEAGCPGIADPGQRIVARAHQTGIPVKPLTGPSSILLALMASGLNGQQFFFHGYLPIQKAGRSKKIRVMEEESRRSGATQVFMETPFRNNALFNDLLKVCRPDTLICIAADLTMETEFIKTQSVAGWRSEGLPGLHKRPAIFLLLHRD